jgi:hypothetical protein
MRLLRGLIVAVHFHVLVPVVFCEEPAAAGDKPTQLRLLDTSIFGKRTTDPILLLEPPRPGSLDPETVMVDIEKGRYFAATVRYPTEITLEAGRKALNSVYGKWEKSSFADDPTMGIWRNEDDKFSIQMTHDGVNLVIIYIKFEMVSKDMLMRGLSRGLQLVNDEDQAKQAVSTMLALLEKSDFETFYRAHCHMNLRNQLSEQEFVKSMRSDEGKKVISLFASIKNAIEQGKGIETLIARFNEQDVQQFEFVLVKERYASGRLWHLELQKEDGVWRVMDFD